MAMANEYLYAAVMYWLINRVLLERRQKDPVEEGDGSNGRATLRVGKLGPLETHARALKRIDVIVGHGTCAQMELVIEHAYRVHSRV